MKKIDPKVMMAIHKLTYLAMRVSHETEHVAFIKISGNISSFVLRFNEGGWSVDNPRSVPLMNAFTNEDPDRFLAIAKKTIIRLKSYLITSTNIAKKFEVRVEKGLSDLKTELNNITI